MLLTRAAFFIPSEPLVASFMIYHFYATAIFQSGIYVGLEIAKQELADS